jgi:hypothetical protein
MKKHEQQTQLSWVVQELSRAWWAPHRPLEVSGSAPRAIARSGPSGVDEAGRAERCGEIFLEARLQKVPGGYGWLRAFLTESQGGALPLARQPRGVGQDTGFLYSAVNPAHGADVVAIGAWVSQPHGLRSLERGGSP